jgi:ribose transport system permease protein
VSETAENPAHFGPATTDIDVHPAGPGPGPGRRVAPPLPVDLLRRGSLIGAWAVMFLVYGALKPSTFLTAGTLQTIFGSQEALVFIALGAMTAFVVGEFDLSVAANMGLSATLVPVLVTVQHVPVALACLIGLAASLAVGAVNAFIIVRLGIDAIITTLGMATLLGGISYRIADSGAVSLNSPTLASIANADFLGLPASFYYGLALAALLTYILGGTALGRHMAFVGSNRSVARLAGIRVQRIRTGAYLASSAMCGLGGILLVGGVGGFDPTTAISYLLPALSATFLGTAVIKPGRFNPAGTIIAIYFLSTGIVGLELLGYAGWISDVFYGAALIIAIILATYLRAGRRAA